MELTFRKGKREKNYLLYLTNHSQIIILYHYKARALENDSGAFLHAGKFYASCENDENRF